MAIREIHAIQREIVQTATLAREAGFDGVELHGTSGYLVDQFLCSNTNLRSDAYGGSVAGRVRFAVETMQALVQALGPHRVALRISPGAEYNDMHDAEPIQTHTALLEALAALPLAYVHVARVPDLFPVQPAFDPLPIVRKLFAGTVVATGNFTLHTAQETLAHNLADMIGFGRPFIANPNLVERLREGHAVAAPAADLFYTAGARGYTDYAA